MMRSRAVLLGVFAVFFWSGVHAQDATRQSPPATGAANYQDRVIEGLAELDVAATDSKPTEYNQEGWARYLRIETHVGTDTFIENRTSTGVALLGFIETPHYGVLSAEASAAVNADLQALTLRQRGFLIDGGWSVQNEAGVIGAPAPALSRQVSRIYMPSTLLEGVSTDWHNQGHGIQWQAGTGRPGRLEGLATSGFRTLAGRVSTAAVQFDREAWQLAARVAQSGGISLLDNPSRPGDIYDADSAQLSLRHSGDQRNEQLNLVTSHASNLSARRSGIWLDGDWKHGQRQNSWGLYWLDRDLSWAGQPLPNNVMGVHARTSWYTREWSAEAGLDGLSSISNPSVTGVFATGGSRWRYNRDVSFGVGSSVRQFNGNAWSAYADTRIKNAWGHSGLRLEVLEELDQRHTESITLDHDWPVPTNWFFATSLTTGRETLQGQSGSRWAAALSASAPLTNSTLLRGNVSSENSDLGSARSGANLGWHWRINPRWTLESSLNYTVGQSRSLVAIDPLAVTVVSSSAPTSSRAVLVVLRYEDRAGARSVPLGGRAQDGGGRIEGTVFQDANRSGHQEASEIGVAGAAVLLNNRYSVRTDSQGRFEFPFVAAGTHVITVLNETLPLPWTAAGDGRSTIVLKVREDVRVPIGVVRQSGD